MKKNILEQILEKCHKLYKEQDEEKDEEIEKECNMYKECQCEQDLHKAFFANNYK